MVMLSAVVFVVVFIIDLFVNKMSYLYKESNCTFSLFGFIVFILDVCTCLIIIYQAYYEDSCSNTVAAVWIVDIVVCTY
jgi:hypothetical protein